MSKKEDVDDYLMDGIYGTRLPKEAERAHFLGTLRERIVIALTKGQVMTNKTVEELEQAMKDHPDTTLLINGTIAYRFLKAEKDLANKHEITYTVVTNEDADTDIGAVLTYDFAIDKADIFIEDKANHQTHDKQPPKSFFDKIKQFFSPK